MPIEIVKTNYGIFRIKVADDFKIDIETRERVKVGNTLSVGGKNTCVFLTIPFDSEIAHLTNLKTKDGGCEETNKKISGENTIGMVNLAFTKVREIAPHIKHIYLSDESDFPCTYKDGTVVGISMILYELIFHQESYYEKRFGAYLKNPILRELYKKAKEGFQKKLPRFFSFRNENVEKVLLPIYLKSTTWQDFFKNIHSLPNICELLFPWYKYALSDIFEGESFERQAWLIDLENNPKLFQVDSTILKKMEGGGRKTRKNKYRNDVYNSTSYINPLFHDEIHKLPLR